MSPDLVHGADRHATPEDAAPIRSTDAGSTRRHAAGTAVPDATIRALVATRIRRLLLAAGIGPQDVVCRIDHEATALRVTLYVPKPLSSSVQYALKVRVLDAIGALGQNMGQVKVTVEPGGREWHAAV